LSKLGFEFQLDLSLILAGSFGIASAKSEILLNDHSALQDHRRLKLRRQIFCLTVESGWYLVAVFTFR
jgi:hypothetical protein